MKLRDGLLLAPVLLIGVMIAAIAFLPSGLTDIVLWSVAGVSGLSIGSYLVLILRIQRRREAAAEAALQPPSQGQADASPD